MKVFNFFAQIFAIFAFLTIGSFLIIVAFHILSLNDAMIKIRELYDSPWRSTQSGFIGLLFITVGLYFAKMLVKKGRESEAIIYQSELGPVVVSVSAIEDAVKRVLKKYHLVKDWKIKTLIHTKDVEIKIRIVLWTGAKVQDLLTEIQSEIHARVSKLLSDENKLEVICDVQKIEDHGVDVPSLDENQSVTV
ncbi:MAG: alkaline shock response membrane anchor protein AmaP [Candidatus Omnitrophica bacterium]|nr:alkaline shock response membrane anchor protein AmaP [Candidatus Omnitrophota bacterium]